MNDYNMTKFSHFAVKLFFISFERLLHPFLSLVLINLCRAEVSVLGLCCSSTFRPLL